MKYGDIPSDIEIQECNCGKPLTFTGMSRIGYALFACYKCQKRVSQYHSRKASLEWLKKEREEQKRRDGEGG